MGTRENNPVQEAVRGCFSLFCFSFLFYFFYYRVLIVTAYGL